MKAVRGVEIMVEEGFVLLHFQSIIVTIFGP